MNGNIGPSGWDQTKRGIRRTGLHLRSEMSALCILKLAVESKRSVKPVSHLRVGPGPFGRDQQPSLHWLRAKVEGANMRLGQGDSSPINAAANDKVGLVDTREHRPVEHEDNPSEHSSLAKPFSAGERGSDTVQEVKIKRHGTTKEALDFSSVDALRPSYNILVEYQPICCMMASMLSLANSQEAPPPGADEESAHLDRVFFALSDPVRRAILLRLDDGPALVSELKAPFPISIQAVSRHIQVLVRSGLVRQERTGRIARCHLDAGPIFNAAVWLNRYTKYWQNQFDDLVAVIERLPDAAETDPGSDGECGDKGGQP